MLNYIRIIANLKPVITGFTPTSMQAQSRLIAPNFISSTSCSVQCRIMDWLYRHQSLFIVIYCNSWTKTVVDYACKTVVTYELLQQECDLVKLCAELICLRPRRRRAGACHITIILYIYSLNVRTATTPPTPHCFTRTSYIRKPAHTRTTQYRIGITIVQFFVYQFWGYEITGRSRCRFYAKVVIFRK